MRKRLLASLLAGSLFLLAACGGGAKPTEQPKETPKDQPPAAAKGVHITVWSHLTEPELAEVEKAANEWAKATGNTVEVIPDQTGFQEFAAAATAGAGPDIMYGLPHDNLGPFYKAGLLAKVPEGVINKAEYEEAPLAAVSYDGDMYAVPISMEAIGLLYNKAMVDKAPETWDDFIKAAEEHGFVYDIKNFYHNHGFIAGMGGYVFKDIGGGLDPNDIGIANDGTKAALQLIYDFVHKYNFMPVDADGDMVKNAFVTGQAAFYLSGPWDISSAQEAGIDVGVAPMPSLPNGQPFAPFIGVYAAFVDAGSKHQEVAWDLVKYLNAHLPEALFVTGNRFPVQKAVAQKPAVTANEIMVGFGKSAANGVPMPNIPEMVTVWDPGAKMLDLVLQGHPIDQTTADAVQAIKDGIAAMQ